MRMTKALDRLTLLATFLRIAERGSISAAARDLGLSQASASRQLADLENRLGVPLIRRTTHSLSLTEQGESCLADARALLAGWEVLADRMAEDQSQLRGPLRVIAPVALGQRALIQAATVFQKNHPQVTLSWDLLDEPIRFAERGCDLWIKAGVVPDDTLVVREVARAERIVAAAPRLLKVQEVNRPADISKLPWVSLTAFEGYQFTLMSKGKTPVQVTATPVMGTNNIFATHEAVRAGLGAAILPRWFIEKDLNAKRLVDVCPGWQTDPVSIQLAYLPSVRQPRRLQAFIAHMAETLMTLPGLEAAA